jgi:anti-sigma-K factor RskA
MGKDFHIDRDTLAIYSLGALEPREARLVGAHIDTCEQCKAAVQTFEAITRDLVEAAPEVDPPASLRARLIAATAVDQPSIRTSIWEKLRSIPLAPLILGVSAILLALNIGLWIQVRQVRQTEQQLIAQVAEDRIVQGLYAYPDLQRALIDGENVYGSAIYEEYLQFAVLYVWGLEPLPPGQVYQAWLIEPDGSRVSGGLFAVQEGDQFVQAVVRAPDMIKGFDAIGITIEPAGGSDHPTGIKVLGVDL